MKIVQRVAITLLIAGCMTAYGCGPNDNKGSMDVKNSNGEGAIDSTRLTNFDSTSTISDTAKMK